MRKKADIITGAVMGVVALIAPIGYVIVEATTKPVKQPKVVLKNRIKPASKSNVDAPPSPASSVSDIALVPVASGVGVVEIEKPVGNSLTLSAPTDEKDDQVALASDETAAHLRAEWFAGQKQTVRVPSISEPLDADHEDPVAPIVSESMRAALAEVGLSSKVAEPVIEPPSAEDLALADVAEVAAVAAMNESDKDDLSEEDRKIAAEFDQKVAAGKVSLVSAVEKRAILESKTDETKRVKVTVVRPKGTTVHQIEAFLIRVTGKGFPILLVRPREAGSPWYAQETLPKQGTYIQARGRFGNANTPEGSPFRMMVAFIPRIEDVPDNGAEIEAIPEGWALSQEIIVTLKRN